LGGGVSLRIFSKSEIEAGVSFSSFSGIGGEYLNAGNSWGLNPIGKDACLSRLPGMWFWDII
jgi:hypothetical protein